MDYFNQELMCVADTGHIAHHSPWQFVCLHLGHNAREVQKG